MSSNLIKGVSAFAATVYGLSAGYGWYSFADPTGMIDNIVVLGFSSLYFLVTTPALYAYWTQNTKSTKSEDNIQWFEATVKKCSL